MDELLKDFLTESAEQLQAIDAQLVRFEQDPTDARIVANIFRLVHAIKGACGFLNLPRLEKVANSAETLIDRLREGAPPDGEMVALVLATVDRIKFLLAALAQGEGEPTGDDSPLIADLRRAAEFAHAPKRLPAPVTALDASFGPGPMPPERRIDTVRISLKSLERLTSLVSELVLTRNQLVDAAKASGGDALLNPLQRLSGVTADLQAGLLAARMMPIERLFGNFHRLVRDLATDLGKKAELVLLGGATELDRQLIETVRDPLAHMIRNAIEHGIEATEDRIRLGKPEVGLVQVSASHKAGIVSIEVADDGRGLDVVSIRDRALAMGLGSREELAAQSDADLCRFVFAPGFTTATHMSRRGRGAGLDIVRTSIDQIGGSVSLTCRTGQGATIILRIPLTLAIVPAFIVTAGGERFALPQHCVEEIVELCPSEESPIVYVEGAPVLNIPDGPLPVADLSDLTRSGAVAPAQRSPPGLVLKMRAGVYGFAIMIDDIVGLQEIVLKPLPAPMLKLALFSAGAILGDGSVVLVLDAAGLSAAIGLPKSGAPRISPPSETKDPARTKVVIFRSGGPELRALPVSAVVRIQRLEPGQAEFADGDRVVRIDGRLIALVGLGRAPSIEASQGTLTALILQHGEDRVAVIVDEIVDVVEEEIRGELPGLSRGVLGVAVLRGEATEVLDPSCLFDQRVRRSGKPAARPKPDEARVLLVEPATFFRKMIAAALASHGFEVRAVSNGAEALAAMRRSRPFAAALVDLDLAAVRDGEVAREIGAVASNCAPALIGLAAHGGRSSQAKARRAGISSAVGKFDRVGMVLAVRSAPAQEVTEIAA